MLGESLVPYTQMVTEKVSSQWVMEAHRSSVAEGLHQEDVIQPTNEVETRSEASVAPAPTKPNVVLTGSELPSSSSTVPSADATGGHSTV